MSTDQIKISWLPNSNDGKILLNNLPEHLQNGSIFIHKNDTVLYIKFFLLFLAFFCVTNRLTIEFLERT